MNPTAIPEDLIHAKPTAEIVNYGPPENNESILGLEDCGHLIVMVERPYAGLPGGNMPICRSFWKPSEEELHLLKLGSVVQLSVWGQQVPVDVQVV